MLLNQLFPHKTCLNLDRRPDRWRRMQAEFARHEIADVRRFSAVDGAALALPATWQHTAGAYGCLLSHIAAVQEARQAGHESLLVFEDDVVFDPELKLRFPSFMQQVPPDWHVLYFGALHKDAPVKVRPNVHRVTKANSTFAYALKRAVFDPFVELNHRAENVLDINAFELQQRFNCYCFMPNLAWVQSEYSDVQNRLERHWYLEKSLVLYGPQVDRLLENTAIVVVHRGPETENLRFLQRYYDEYFGGFAEILIAESVQEGISESNSKNQLFLLTDSDLYLEAMDIRANLLMCEEYDGATGFSEVIELTPEQAELLRKTGITRGIDVSKNKRAPDVRNQCRFIKREAFERGQRLIRLPPAQRVFKSPNHALRLPQS